MSADNRPDRQAIRARYEDITSRMNAINDEHKRRADAALAAFFSDMAGPRGELADFLLGLSYRQIVEQMHGGPLGILEELLFKDKDKLDKTLNDALDDKAKARLRDPKESINDVMGELAEQAMSKNPLKGDPKVRERKMGNATIFETEFDSAEEMRGFLKGKFDMTDEQVDTLLRKKMG